MDRKIKVYAKKMKLKDHDLLIKEEENNKKKKNILLLRRKELQNHVPLNNPWLSFSDFLQSFFFSHPFFDAETIGKQHHKYLKERLKERIKDSLKRELQSNNNINNKTQEEKDPLEEELTEKFISEITSTPDIKTVRFFYFLLRKLWRKLFTNVVQLNLETHFKKLIEIQKQSKISIVLVPTHKSYIDFLILSYLCVEYNIELPFVVAGDHLLNLFKPIVAMLKRSGAIFMKTSFHSVPSLYKIIFKEYIYLLLFELDNPLIEFYIEGTRSRNGNVLAPKFGIVNMIIESFLNDKEVNDIYFIPIHFNYEKLLESDIYVNQLLGDFSVNGRPSFFSELNRILKNKFGELFINFGEPISLLNYIKYFNNNNNLMNNNNNWKRQLCETFSYHITNQLLNLFVAMPTHLLLTILFIEFGHFNKSTLKLDYLIKRIVWLKEELEKHHVMVYFGINGELPFYQVLKTLELMENVVERIDSFITLRSEDALMYLTLYRNNLSHVFMVESIMLCALYSLQKEFNFFVLKKKMNGKEYYCKDTVNNELLLEKCKFLSDLISIEIHPSFLISSNNNSDNNKDNFEKGIKLLKEREMILEEMNDDNLTMYYNLFNNVNNNGKVIDLLNYYIEFLGSLIWPFIDSYLLVLQVLLSSIYCGQLKFSSITNLLQKIQQFSSDKYQFGKIKKDEFIYFETRSISRLENILKKLIEWKVIVKNNNNEIEILISFNELQCLYKKIQQFKRNDNVGVITPHTKSNL